MAKVNWRYTEGRAGGQYDPSPIEREIAKTVGDVSGAFVAWEEDDAMFLARAILQERDKVVIYSKSLTVDEIAEIKGKYRIDETTLRSSSIDRVLSGIGTNGTGTERISIYLSNSIDQQPPRTWEEIEPYVQGPDQSWIEFKEKRVTNFHGVPGTFEFVEGASITQGDVAVDVVRRVLQYIYQNNGSSQPPEAR
ncbi:hypothetical protein GOV09_06600 [Candidatus Woesearchaeota archaeon]|nr:hypothetical protein [Candidatus Woesearchaeota archaeon]